VEVLRRKLLVLAFFDEFVPLYTLFALWWQDNGISTARISLVFALWATVSLVLEIPSGALADQIDRRLVIGAAYLLRMAGIASFLIWPTLAGVVIGSILWATHDALASGAWEAMIYDELERLGEGDSYSAVMARLTQAAWVAVAVSAVVAWALVGTLGITGVGWMSVALLMVALVLVLRLPKAPAVEEADEVSGFRAWVTTLRRGVSDARTVPSLGRLVVLGSLLETLTLIEEYIPFLARRAGAADNTVPIILGLAWLGFVAGAELAARRPDLARQTQAFTMVGAVVVAVVAIQGRGSPFLVVGLAFLHLSAQSSMVLTDARLQERATGAVRATITSVRGFLTGVLTLLAFVMMSALDRGGDVRLGLFVLLVPALASAVLLWRWLPTALASNSTDFQQR
jgi:MFS family permease